MSWSPASPRAICHCAFPAPDELHPRAMLLALLGEDQASHVAVDPRPKSQNGLVDMRQVFQYNFIMPAEISRKVLPVAPENFLIKPTTVHYCGEEFENFQPVFTVLCEAAAN